MMNKTSKTILLSTLALLTTMTATRAADPAPAKYELTQTLKIGGEGRWDYVGLSEDGKMLYITRSNHMQAIDAATGKVMGDVTGMQGTHGAAIAPGTGHGFISDGKAGTVVIFDTKTYETLGSIKADEDADGIIYEPFSKKIMTVCGDAGVLITIPADVDPKTGKADAPIELGGKPEFFVSDNAGHVYVNLVDKNQIAVVDTKTMAVTAHWPTAPGVGPMGAAMDRAKGVLYIGCRNNMMVMISTKDGAVLGSAPIGRGCDATGFDKGVGYASCGDSTVTAIGETSPGKYGVIQTIATAPGARTMGIDPNTGKIYLPTADSTPTTQAGKRPQMLPGTFKLIVLEPVMPK